MLEWRYICMADNMGECEWMFVRFNIIRIKHPETRLIPDFQCCLAV